MIYRKSCFGHRKSFCFFGSVRGFGRVLGDSGGYSGPSGGVSRPKGSHGLWEEINQPLVGWNKFPLRPIRFEKEKHKVERVSKWEGGILLQVGLE